MATQKTLKHWSLWQRLPVDSPQELVRWWWNDLINCLPGPLRRVLAGPQERLLVVLSGKIASIWRENEHGRTELVHLDRDAPSPADLPGVHNVRKIPIVLRLPTEMVLKKNLRLPASVGENLRQVLGFEMDRLTPFSADQVFYDFRILKRDTEQEKLEIELALAPRDRVEPWLQALASARVSPSVVAPADGWPGVNLLPLAQRGGNGGAGSRITLMLGALVLGLLAAALMSPLLQKQALVESLGEDVVKARRQANQVIDLREEVQQTLASARYVLDRRLQTRPVVDVLQEVTQLLPDDTWLQQLELKSDKLQLRGESAQALGLIGQLETSPLFQEVVFLSPVVQVPGKKKERFHLSARVTKITPETGETE